MAKFTARWATLLGMAAALIAAPLASQAAQDSGRSRVIVSFKPGAAAAARAALAKAGGRVTVDLSEVNAVAVDLPRKAIAALKRNRAVEFIEEDSLQYAFATTAPSAPPYELGQLEPYGIRMVQADQLSDALTGNRKLCIIDSGYDIAHEDLSGNPVDGENLTTSGDWNTDESGHGTHVAGTVAAINQPNVGVVGVNPNKYLNLHIVKVFDASGSAPSSRIAKAMLRCRAAGANVVSMSLGGPTPGVVQERIANFLTNRGILVIAAAGNAGDSSISYPAGFASVMSVAAIDENKVRGSFSQFNPDVEIAAPGVDVLSSVPMGTGREASLTVSLVNYSVNPLDGTPAMMAAAPLADFGLGEAVDPAMAGKVCLIQRGNIAFADKVLNCQNSGGVGAIIYNNAPGNFFGTLGGVATTIPSVSASQEDGTVMLGQLGQTATIDVIATNYAFFNGTSMATPHVSAVAALVWSHNLGCTNEQLRTSMTLAAEDLGAAGRDDEYGFGLVQAKATHDRIQSLGCGQ